MSQTTGDVDMMNCTQNYSGKPQVREQTETFVQKLTKTKVDLLVKNIIHMTN